MSIEVRTLRMIVNEKGRISVGKDLNIKVRFDLTETQDFFDWVPGMKFNFGDLRYSSRYTRKFVSLVFSRTRVNLKGDGVYTSVFMNNSVAFTVINDAYENRI
jgi:hypothetical protein